MLICDLDGLKSQTITHRLYSLLLAVNTGCGSLKCIYSGAAYVIVLSKRGGNTVRHEGGGAFPEPGGVPPEPVASVVASDRLHALHELSVPVDHLLGVTCPKLVTEGKILEPGTPCVKSIHDWAINGAASCTLSSPLQCTGDAVKRVVVIHMIVLLRVVRGDDRAQLGVGLGVVCGDAAGGGAVEDKRLLFRPQRPWRGCRRRAVDLVVSTFAPWRLGDGVGSLFGHLVFSFHCVGDCMKGVGSRYDPPYCLFCDRAIVLVYLAG